MEPMENSSKANDGSRTHSFRISDILEKKEYEAHMSPSLLSPSSTSEHENIPDDNSPPVLKKIRKARTIFTEKQLQELEATFRRHKYLSVQERQQLAHQMGLSDIQVKTWYQNRRALALPEGNLSKSAPQRQSRSPNLAKAPLFRSDNGQTTKKFFSTKWKRESLEPTPMLLPWMSPVNPLLFLLQQAAILPQP